MVTKNQIARVQLGFVQIKVIQAQLIVNQTKLKNDFLKL